MELKAALKQLRQSHKFKEWFKNNNKTYFSYAFTMIENNEQADWQIGYYNKEKDKVTTFIVQKNILINPEEDIFKKSDMDVKEIDIDKVKLALNKILAKLDKFQKENYPRETILKKIIILQNFEKLGNIWNVTFITHGFSTLNIKVKADNGRVVEHNLAPLFEFQSEK